MNVNILVALIISALICALIGVTSIYKPKYVGAEFSLEKSKKFYALKYIEPTNNYYLRYIEIIGVGLIFTSLILLGLSVIYVFNPSRLII